MTKALAIYIQSILLVPQSLYSHQQKSHRLKKFGSIVLSFAIFVSFFSFYQAQTLTASAETNNFTFNGSMSEDALRSYASRAVTLAGLCAEGLSEDPIFEEDLRMVQRTGAKYIGRAAYYSWSGNMSAAQIEQHYAIAAKKAELVHKADPDIILQAGVFEIMYKETVNNTAIPSWVFQAFDLPVVRRNFNWYDMQFPSGSQYSGDFWGSSEAAVPYIVRLETQMYFYYCICRYIDAGYESIHLGQAEMMMGYAGNSLAIYWDTVTTKARAYAHNNGRRKLILFDAHDNIDSGGIKVGNRLVMDIQAAALVPIETYYQNGALMCTINDYSSGNSLQWIGRSDGGEHPLGFTIAHNITILEFDNYGGNGNHDVPTSGTFHVWGYDDITWFAVQPDWYRNQFMLECDAYLKSHCLDSNGNQVYFLQPSCRRILSADPDYPVITYTPDNKFFNNTFLNDYIGNEETTAVNNNNTYTLTITKSYRANRQSDGCPNGFGQENTIRQIFLGTNAVENPELNAVVLPSGYVDKTITEFRVNAQGQLSPSEPGIDESTLAVGGLNGVIYDYWEPYRSPEVIASGICRDTRKLVNGEYNIYRFELNGDATSFKLDDWYGQGNNNHFTISASTDNVTYFEIASYTSDTTVLQNSYSWSNFVKNEANIRTVLLNAQQTTEGKKIVYIKLMAKRNDTNGELCFNNFKVFSTCRANAKTTEFRMNVLGQVSPGEPGIDESSLVVGNLNGIMYDYWEPYRSPEVIASGICRDTRKLVNGEYNIYRFELKSDATSFKLDEWYGLGNSNNFTISASTDNSNYLEIATYYSANTLLSGSYFWRNFVINGDNIATVVANAQRTAEGKKIVYVKLQSSKNTVNGELCYNNFKVYSTWTTAAAGIAVRQIPTITNYDLGDGLDISGGILSVLYDNGSSKNINITADMVSGFNNTKIGTQQLTITHLGYTTNYNIQMGRYKNADLRVNAQGQLSPPEPGIDESSLVVDNLNGVIYDYWEPYRSPEVVASGVCRDTRKLVNGESNTYRFELKGDASSFKLDEWYGLGNSNHFSIWASADDITYVEIFKYSSATTVLTASYFWSNFEKNENQYCICIGKGT